MTKRSVSLAIHDPGRPGYVLLVQRPADDDDLPNVWGLPAASLTGTETWEEAAQRAGRDKLGIELDVGPVLSAGTLQRSGYVLEMKLLDARIRSGTPSVPQAAPGVTQYQGWHWGPASELTAAAARGSLCGQLYLGSTNRRIDE